MNPESYTSKPNEVVEVESNESRERGKNVEIVIKFMRHGERTKEGNLTDYGREITKQRAVESNISSQDFHAVKAIGSNAGPVNEHGIGRSLETAEIYAHEIAGDEAFTTRKNKFLNYETLKSEIPYDHTAIYDSALPDNFDDLPDDEKAVAAKRAQTAVVNHLLSLHTPEAEAYKQEMAGVFATVVEHYQKMTNRLNSGSKVLLPSGTHGGMMEHLLQQALVREDEEGNKTIGFEHIEDIGGEFDPSESYSVDVKTNENGDLQEATIFFDNPNRPVVEKMYLDPDIVRSLAQSYKELHQEDEIA